MSTPDQTTFTDELRGVMFRNDKGDNPARPDYRGRCMIEGKRYRMSAWVREAKESGQSYLSISYTLHPDETPAPAAAPPVAAPAAAPPADDLPF